MKKDTSLKTVLPQGVTIKPYYIQADFVNESVKSVTDSLWIRLALAIIVAIIFLRSFKASATILITIPVNIVFNADCNLCGRLYVKHNDIGCYCCSIGLIIDDAIVVVEQIHRTHEEHPEEPFSTLFKKQFITYFLQCLALR